MTETDTANRAKLLPFYLVIDVSFSMDGPKLEQSNRYLPALTDALLKNPIVSDKVRFGLIDFADEAELVLPLCDLAHQTELPELECRGGTSYSAAFRLLRDQIARDVLQLKADEFKVHRPAVFFISDGQPTEPEATWRTAFDELTAYDKATGTGFREFPNVIPFGVEDADRATMNALIHPQKRSKMFMQTPGTDPSKALAQIAEILIATTINSATNLAQGEAGVVLPDATEIGDGIEVHEYEDFL